MKVKQVFKFILLIFAMNLLLCLNACAFANEIQKKDVEIAVIFDGASSYNSQIFTTLKNEIELLLGDRYQINYRKIVPKSWSEKERINLANELLDDEDVDFIINAGFSLFDFFQLKQQLSKPVISPFKFQLETKELKSKNNFYVIPKAHTFISDIKDFKGLVCFDYLAVIIGENLSDYKPKIESLISRCFNLKVKVIVVSDNTFDCRCLEEVDAVYIAPVLSFKENDFKSFISYINAKKIPSFSYLGVKEVEKGVFATKNTYGEYLTLARQTSLILEEILQDYQPVQPARAVLLLQRYIINLETAEKIGYIPTWQIKTNSSFIGDEEKSCRVIESLSSIINKASDSNLDLEAKFHEVLAVKENINIAASKFKPHLEVSAFALGINSNAQILASGAIARNTLGASMLLTQPVYSDKVYTNYDIQKYFYSLEQEKNRELIQDIKMLAASEYINLLKAKNTLYIQRRNLDLSRFNLEDAKRRNMAGASSMADVYRFKVRISKNKKEVLNAESSINLQRIILNRLINLPLSCLFCTKEIDIYDTLFMTQNQKIVCYLANKDFYPCFVNFIIAESIANSPEIKQKQYQISAKKREVKGIKREYYLPDVGLLGAYAGFFDDNNNSGSLGFLSLYAELPILDGGERSARLKQAQEELMQLEIQKYSITEKIEERTRSALINLGNSYPNIELTHNAFVNSTKNLELIRKGYKVGENTILELLDAQNAALDSELLASNAIYDFIDDLIVLQRLIGDVDSSMSGQNWDKWFNRLEKYCSKSQACE